MKKKLEKYLIDVATDIKWSIGVYCYRDMEDNYYVMNDTHIIRLRESVPGMQINAHATDMIDTARRHMSEIETYDYKMMELPSVEHFKQSISNLVGRKMIKVVWTSNEKEFDINARYLYKMMYALNSKVCYWKDAKSPIFLFEDDDLQGSVVGMILPIHKEGREPGLRAVG